MNKVYFLLLVLVFLIPINTKAYYDVIDSRCVSTMKLSLKNEAEEIAYRLSKNVDNKENVTYNLILYNLSDNFVVKDGNDNILKDNKIDNLKPGTRIVLNFYVSNKSYCEGYRASVKTINIPYYNKFYTSELCTGYESYYLCQENSNINNITEEEFNKKMNDYIDSLKKNDVETSIIIQEEEQSFMDYLYEYWIYIVSFILIMLLIVILLIISNKKKNKNDIL